MNIKNLQSVREYITRIMPLLEQPPTGRIIYPWLTVTHGPHYGYTIYTWDQHHAAMRFAVAGRPEYLRHTVDNLLYYQQSDGHTPSVVHAERGPRFLDVPYHAQPFLCQAATMYVHLTQDNVWGMSVIGKLMKYLDFYDRVYTAAHGLKRWRTGWAGGLDNDVATAFLPPDTVASVDINAWFYLELLAARKLASLLGHQQIYEQLVPRVTTQNEIVNRLLWYDNARTYAAYNLCDGRHMFELYFEDVPESVGRYAFHTSTNLIPLYARMADHARAKEMIDTYVINENHFWSPHGIRTLSKASEYYNNAVLGNPSRFGDHRRMTESNWQGPVWVPMCYFVFHGLRYYGYKDMARKLADNIITTLARSLEKIGSFSENFHGETGQPLYATCYASWNMLADTMHDDLERDEWIMDPVFN